MVDRFRLFLCKTGLIASMLVIAACVMAGCTGASSEPGAGEIDEVAKVAEEVTTPVTDFADVQYLSRQATFSWTAVTGANTVRIEQSPIGEDAWTTAQTGTIAVNMASATVAGLTPDTEYKFRLKVTGGAHAGESNVVSFKTMPTYTVTYSAGVGGTIVGESTQTVDYNASSKIVTAMEEPGYRFVQWDDGLTSPTRTDKGIQSDLNMSAHFEVGETTGTPISDFADVVYLSRQATFRWSAAQHAAAIHIEQSPLAEDAWTMATTGFIPVNATSATVTGLTPVTDYKFRLVVTGGPNKGESNVISFTMMPTYKLTYSAEKGGVLSGAAEQVVDYRGSGKTVTAVADPGYRFVRWSDGGTEAARTDTDVTAALNVRAEFEAN